MLEHWLQPVSKVLQRDSGRWKSLGHQLHEYTKKGPVMDEVQVALIGWDPTAALAIRQELYAFTSNFPEKRLVDLGDIRKPKPNFAVPLFRELVQGQIVPVVIGADFSTVVAQFQAYCAWRSMIHHLSVDEQVRFYPPAEGQADAFPLNQILPEQQKQLALFSHIGLQGHINDPEVFRYLDKKWFDYLRLGQARSQIAQTEPLLRDADMLNFHLSALKKSEAPAQETHSAGGFTLEEGCRISRYAGLSDKLSSASFTGLDPRGASLSLSANVVAQLVWYFLEGFFQRKNDFPKSVDGLTEYVVHFKQQDLQVTFWKSTRSGRWWMEVPEADLPEEATQYHHLVPCSYEDYLKAGQNELPERLLKAFRRLQS